MLTDAEAALNAFATFPKAHWRRLWSANPLERVNYQTKRSNVVGTLPDDASVIRLIGAVLIDVHDQWQAADRRYFSEESMKPITDPTSTNVTNYHGGGIASPQLHER